ncbi:MAG: TAT-variant-translocated molybdopterin oxidoreductase [Gemmataceae bacterium]
MKRKPIDPELLRDRLSAMQGKQYWRCLEELSDDPEFRDMLTREFAPDSSVWADGLSRRKFLGLMGASLALAGLSGCRPPTGKIMPYVRQPENLVLGKPLYYATIKTLSGFATGLLAESHEGRPTKIEGNEKHPSSRGAASVLHQASILNLYDPDRSQSVLFRGQARAWGDLIEVLRARLRPDTPRAKGKGVAVLTEAIGSPTLLWQKSQFLAAYPEAKWYTYEPVNRDNAHDGAEIAFGRRHHSYPKVDAAEVIVSLDADFLGTGPAQLISAREFSDRRRLVEVTEPNGKKEMRPGGRTGLNRLYVIETDYTITGACADNRLAVKPSQVDTFARALAARLGVPETIAPENLDPTLARWVDAIAKDLRERAAGQPRSAGTTLVLAGDGQPPAVHAIVHAINAHLGNFGKTVLFTDPLPFAETRSNTSLEQLIKTIDAGEVDTLLILGGNPVYTAPYDLNLGVALENQLKKPLDKWLAVHVGMLMDETSRLCHWHVPQRTSSKSGATASPTTGRRRSASR